jgi:hypothetical protein
VTNPYTELTRLEQKTIPIGAAVLIAPAVGCTHRKRAQADIVLPRRRFSP